LRSITGHLRTGHKDKLHSHVQAKAADIRSVHSFEYLGIAQC
jgi:hypothetical protein